MEYKFLSFLKTTKEQPLKLYDQLDNTPVTVFFKILNDGNVNLLNPLNQKLPANLDLNKVWINLLEKYYIAKSKTAYEATIRRLKQKEILRNKITSCTACYLSIKNGLNVEHSKQTLVYFGIKDEDHEVIKRKIARESSLLKKFDTENSKQNKKEVINFWELLSKVEDGLGRPISFDVEKVTIAHWIEVIKLLKEKSKKTTNRNGKK